MSLINNEILSVTRTSESDDYVEGAHVAGTDSVFKIECNVQPVTGNALLQLSDGERNRQPLSLFTKTEMKIKDVVTRRGIPYEVLRVEDWTGHGPLSHYAATMVTKDI